MNFPLLTTSSELICWGILLIFLLSFGLQAFYYFKYFYKVAFLKDQQTTLTTTLPISVVICARNEYENLQKHLPEILALDYPNFEVVVVNDCSYDSSKDLLEEFEKKYSNLKVTTLEEATVYQHDKKFAVTIGIKAAKNEHILFTDADCIPKTKTWILEMCKHFSSGKEIIIGYGAYKKEQGFLNKIIRFDAFFIALQYFSSAIIGKPYMAVGRNMAYTKSLFFRNKGFASHAHIRSGDDDLFVNKVGTAYNTAFVLNANSHTISLPKNNFSDWFEQKQRHLTTAPHYKTRDKVFTTFQFISLFFFYISMVCLIIFKFQLLLVLVIFIARTCLQFIIFKKAMERLDEKDLIWGAILYEVFLMFIYPFIHLANTFNQEPRWK